MFKEIEDHKRKNAEAITRSNDLKVNVFMRLQRNKLEKLQKLVALENRKLQREFIFNADEGAAIIIRITGGYYHLALMGH